MKDKKRFVLIIGLFVIAIIVSVTNSVAFNTFKSAQDESNLNNEQMNILRETRDLNRQILEQAKITNEFIRKR